MAKRYTIKLSVHEVRGYDDIDELEVDGAAIIFDSEDVDWTIDQMYAAVDLLNGNMQFNMLAGRYGVTPCQLAEVPHG